MAVFVLFPVDSFSGVLEEERCKWGLVYFRVMFGDIFPCECLLDCFIIFVFLGVLNGRILQPFWGVDLVLFVLLLFCFLWWFLFNKLVLKLFLGLFECLVLWFCGF